MVEDNIPEQLKQCFDCPICFEEYAPVHMPCTLRCGHTLCTHCILKLLKPNAFFTCPMDKKTFKLQLIAGNLSYMNLILRVKAFYHNTPFNAINNAKIKYTKPCKAFASGKNCSFGENCKYLHVKLEEESSDSDSDFGIYYDSDESYSDDDHIIQDEFRYGYSRDYSDYYSGTDSDSDQW